METYDLIVVGLGAVGSAALCQAALRGVRVLGIDRFQPPHDLGSSHGETRITRQAIGEGAQFVPLVLGSNVLWRELEEAAGEQLMVQNGGLILLDGAEAEGAGAAFCRQTVACARDFGIAHELLGGKEIRERFPQFMVGEGAEGYLEAGAGFLYPERCVAAQLKVARENRAEVRTGEIITEIVLNKDGVVVVANRSTYSAGGVVLTPGPWMSDWARAIVGLDAAHFSVYRQTLYWFGLDGEPSRFSPEKMPIFLWSSAQVEKGFYGFPSLDGLSMKVATEQFEVVSSADEGKVAVSSEEEKSFFDSYVRGSIRG
jgi:sarcosine oxidase